MSKTYGYVKIEPRYHNIHSENLRRDTNIINELIEQSIVILKY